MGVCGDVSVDVKGERKSGATGGAGDAGFGARAHGVEKVFKLEAKGFASGDVGLLGGEGGGGVVGGGGCGGGGGDGRPCRHQRRKFCWVGCEGG